MRKKIIIAIISLILIGGILSNIPVLMVPSKVLLISFGIYVPILVVKKRLSTHLKSSKNPIESKFEINNTQTSNSINKEKVSSKVIHKSFIGVQDQKEKILVKKREYKKRPN